MRTIWTGTMLSNPWRDLPVPSASATLSARRVEAGMPWDFFWARDGDRKCLLVLNHAEASAPRQRLPKLRDIAIDLLEDGKSPRLTLSLKLLESTHQDLFYRLCIDIVQATTNAKTEKEAVATALSRTWRWHHLLRRGEDGRLSPDEQKGLIGELLVIERFLLPNLSPVDSLNAWSGPLGSPKDFEVGRTAVEAKARRGAAKPFIAISSEYQLDPSGLDHLYLHVIDLDQVPVDAQIGDTVTDVAYRVGHAIRLRDESAHDVFESILLATGFDWNDDYSEIRWAEGSTHIYHVRSGFPCITPGSLITGVSSVSYSISLTECAPFAVGTGELVAAILGK